MAAFRDTPNSLRKRLAVVASKSLSAMARRWPDYYHQGLLYTVSRVPTSEEIYKLLCRRDGWKYARAFAAIEPLAGKSNHPEKNTVTLDVLFLDGQAPSVISDVRFLLTKYFSAWSRRAIAAYRYMPPALAAKLQAYRAKLSAAWQRKWKELSDPAYNSNLYPTGASVLGGSGVRGY
jgi:hypothetical protein